MSIRMLAVEFYRIYKEMEELEKRIANLAPGSQQRGDSERRLMEAKAEQAWVKTLLDGAKEK